MIKAEAPKNFHDPMQERPRCEGIDRTELLEAVEKVIRRGGGVLDIYDLIKWYGKE